MCPRTCDARNHVMPVCNVSALRVLFAWLFDRDFYCIEKYVFDVKDIEEMNRK